MRFGMVALRIRVPQGGALSMRCQTRWARYDDVSTRRIRNCLTIKYILRMTLKSSAWILTAKLARATSYMLSDTNGT